MLHRDDEPPSSDCASPARARDADDRATRWIDIELVEEVAQDFDPQRRVESPVAGARFVVESAGRRVTGVLGVDGRARVRVPHGAATVTFPDYDGDAVEPA